MDNNMILYITRSSLFPENVLKSLDNRTMHSRKSVESKRITFLFSNTRVGEGLALLSEHADIHRGTGANAVFRCRAKFVNVRSRRLDARKLIYGKVE